MQDEISKRVDELEQRLAFQEDILENLNRVIAKQDGEIAALRQHVAGLTTRLREIEGFTHAAASDSAAEPPPHY